MTPVQMKQALEAEGYVVIKASSYRRAQERQRMARVVADTAEERYEKLQQWLERDVHPESRLADRLTHVYGVARAHGATVEELRQPE